MLDINENTRLLFLKAVNDLDEQLKYYAKKKDANADYIRRKNKQIQDIFNFYNEVETLLQNRRFNRDVFVIEGGADREELNRLRAENKALRQQLNGSYPNRRIFGSRYEREAFRAFHNSKQREIFGY